MKRLLTTDHRPPKERTWDWIILLVYTILTLILTYPLIFNLTTAVPNDIGDPLLNTWLLAWDTHALLTDPLNLFNANIFYPLSNTLAYSEHLFSTALLALPWQVLFGEPVLAYNLSLLLSFPLAAFGMYLLALRWTHHRGAAFIAGLIFAFNPYRFASIAHLQLLTFQWLPYAVLCLDLLLVKQGLGVRDQGVERTRVLKPALLAALAIFFLLQVLASWYLALYTVLVLGIYLLAVLVTRRVHPTQLIPILVTLLLATLLTLPFILPYLSLVDELRESRPLSLALSLAAAPTDYFAAASLNRIFGPLTEPFRARPGFVEEHTLFLGVIVGLLVLVGFIGGVRCQVSGVKCQVSSARCQVPGVKCQVSSARCQVPGVKCWLPRYAFYALVVVLVFSFILTFSMPYAMLATIFPPATVVRVPSRWIIPGLFALSGLAAFGVVYLTQHASRPTKYAILATISLLLIIESFSIPLPLAPVDNNQTLNPAYHWLATQPGDVALVELPMHSAPAPEYPEVKRMVASTLGWWHLVNGYSGYTPPRQPELARNLKNFPDDNSIQTLQTFVDPTDSSFRLPPSSFFVLLHPGDAPLDRTQWETTGRWLAERNPALYPIGEFQGDYLYQVLPEASSKFAAFLAAFGPNQNIRLLAARVELTDLRNTQYVTRNSPLTPRILLYWQASAPLPPDATIFIHLRAADGFVRSQADGPPVSGHYPTSLWQPGEIIQDIHPLPSDDFSQVDHIVLGLYDPVTSERLPAFGPDGRRLADDAVVVRIENR